MNPFTDRAKSMIASLEHDERIKDAAAATKAAAARAQEASRNVSRKVAQADSWEELRTAVEQLTEIARAHHAVLVDLIDRVETLELRAGIALGEANGR
jgi:phage-related minor tail protein